MHHRYLCVLAALMCASLPALAQSTSNDVQVNLRLNDRSITASYNPKIGVGGSQGDRLFLSLSDDSSSGSQFYYIDSVEIALTLLADQRFKPLWPALIEMTGPDMEHLRNLLIKGAQQHFDHVMALPSDASDRAAAAEIADRKERAYTVYARALFDNGKPAEADRILVAGIAALAVDPVNGDNLRSLYIVRAKYRSDVGDLGGALEILHEAEARLQKDRTTQLPNILLNRAQILADGGSYVQAAEQLALLDTILPRNKGKSEVSGARRQIEATRACISTRLGQLAQAEASFAAMGRNKGKPDAAYSRAVFCADDRARIMELLIADSAQPLPAPVRLLRLQPAFKSRPGMAALPLSEADARVQKIYQTTFRHLPLSMEAALNHWQ